MAWSCLAGVMRLGEPEIVRQGGRYCAAESRRQRDSMIRANVMAEVRPQLGGEEPRVRYSGFLRRGSGGPPAALGVKHFRSIAS